MTSSGVRFTMLLAVAFSAASVTFADEIAATPLPWQRDYATAVAKARAQHKHMVVMLTATDSEPCRQLERESLADPLIREGLADMVWVQVQNDPGLETELGAQEHPTLAFVNPFTGSVLHRVGGHAALELLARHLVHARRAIGLPLTPGLEPVAKRMFSFDEPRATALLAAGDVAGLAALLGSAADDDSRLANYLLIEVELPAGLVPDDVRLLVGTDCLVGWHPAETADPLVAAGADLAESCTEYPLPESRLVLVPLDRGNGPEASVRMTAPGCRLVEDRIRFGEASPESGPASRSRAAVQVRRYEVCRLADAEAARLSGRVLTPAGAAAARAIVRIDDWFPARDEAAASTRTDADGRFLFPQVPPGRWLVRAEFPGGEREQFVEIAAAGETVCELTLEPVTTVGLRWALQTRELSQSFDGAGVQTGEAFVSVASSRLNLAWGTRVRTADYGDIMLAQTPLADDTLPAAATRMLEQRPAGTPVWYLFDAAYTEDFHPLSGLHRESRPFAAINVVREDDPLPDQEWAINGPVLPQALAATREQNTFFQFTRGEPVRAGDVFTLRCVMRNCFAKIEVTDVTIVTPPASR